MHYKRRSRSRDREKMQPCGCCPLSIVSAGKEPIDDGPCTGKRRSQRAPKAKERCPAAGTHDWVREWRVEKKVDVWAAGPYWACDDCRALIKDWWDRDYCRVHRREAPYEVRTKVALCVECGVVKKEKVKDEHSYWRARRRKKLPKRTVKF